MLAVLEGESIRTSRDVQGGVAPSHMTKPDDEWSWKERIQGSDFPNVQTSTQIVPLYTARRGMLGKTRWEATGVF